ncbi:MAG: hypothetical protein IJO74_04630 [Clostridia bacterium]|nr:hypothetical protein [Clostridia bacterium]
MLKICISSHNNPLFAAVCSKLAGKALIIDNFSADCNILVPSLVTIFDGYGDVCVLDSSRLQELSGKGKIGYAVSCGMGERDTVNFSSIDLDKAVLCVQRDINFRNFTLERGEFPTFYDQNLTIWQNLAVSFCCICAEINKKE